jgi:hypothetical protein
MQKNRGINPRTLPQPLPDLELPLIRRNHREKRQENQKGGRSKEIFRDADLTS